MRHTLRRSARTGFTLVELLVASALIVLMMAVMATAFQSVLKAFSDLNSAANMADQLRAMQDIFAKDLESQHLEDEEGQPVRVSDPRVRSNTGWRRPGQKGYFFIGQGSEPKQQYLPAQPPMEHSYVAPTVPPPLQPPYVKEGIEDTIASYRASDHWIQFTVRRSGSTPNDAFVTKAHPRAIGGENLNDFATPTPGVSLLIGRWAEVAYFLRPTGTQTDTNGDPNAKAVPLFALHRRQRGLVDRPSPPSRLLNPGVSPDYVPGAPVFDSRSFPDLAVWTDPSYFPGPPPAPGYIAASPADVTDSAKRLGGILDTVLLYQHSLLPVGAPLSPPFGLPYAIPQNWPDTGSDILLANVVSMQIQVMSELSHPNAYPLPGGIYRRLPVELPSPNASGPPWYAPPAYTFPSGYFPQSFGYHDLGLGYEDPRFATPPESMKPGYPAIFDTAATQYFPPYTPPMGMAPPPNYPSLNVPAGRQSIAQLHAVQITLRVYDPKTKLTRQITIRKPL